ncbi:MAG: hypothetical protein IJN61_07090 [Clostridia bacterium]|nr:hypothetical protein [Clostridia bacterium]
MSDIRAWSAAVCMAALGCSAVRLLAPKAGSGKLFSLITASFFLCALALPVLNIRSLPKPEVDLLPPDIVTGLLEKRVTEQLTEQVEAAAVAYVEEALATRNISPKKVEVMTDTSDSGGIYMKQITIYVDKQSVPIAAVVREVLEKGLGMTIVLKTEE